MNKNDKFHQGNSFEISDESLEQVSGGARLSNGVTLNAKPGYVLKGYVNNKLKCHGCGGEKFNMYVFQYDESDKYYECYNCGAWQ